MKKLLEMSLIMSTIVVGYGLLMVGFLLGLQALLSLVVGVMDNSHFGIAVLAANGLAFFIFAFFFNKIRRAATELWSQLLRNL